MVIFWQEVAITTHTYICVCVCINKLIKNVDYNTKFVKTDRVFNSKHVEQMLKY